MDYTECFATATYDVLVARLLEYARTVEGVVVAADCSGTHQTLKGAYFSTAIKPENARSALPMKTVTTAIQRLPGPRDLLSLRGQTPQKQPSALAAAWCEKLKMKLTARELSTEKLDAFFSSIKSKQPEQPFGTVAAWTATTPIAHYRPPSPKDAKK